MSFLKTTVDEFKTYFARDFPYGSDISKNVLDADIQRGIDEAFSEMNQSLFGTQEEFDIPQEYLSAHYLVMNIRDSSQGLSGQFEWAVSSKGVGSVSTSFSVPSEVTENARMSHLAKTNYGARYVSILWPLLVGNIFISEGCTTS